MNTLFKPLQYILGIALVLALLYGLANRLAPGWVAEVRSWLGNPVAWSDEAKRHDPTGYLQQVRGQLEGQKANLQSVITNIRTNLNPLDQHIQDNTEELAKTKAFLSEGRALYQQAQDTAQTQNIDAIKFAGRIYPGVNEFRAQLALLYSEQQTKATLLEKANTTKQRLHEQLYAMLAQATKVEMALSEIGPRIAIAQAAKAVEELDGIIASVDSVSLEVLDNTQQVMDDYNPIGTTRELLETARQQPVAATSSYDDTAFAAFLQERN